MAEAEGGERRDAGDDYWQGRCVAGNGTRELKGDRCDRPEGKELR